MLVPGLSGANCHHGKTALYYCGGAADVLRCPTCVTGRCGPRYGCQCTACRTLTERPGVDRKAAFITVCETLQAMLAPGTELPAQFLALDGLTKMMEFVARHQDQAGSDMAVAASGVIGRLSVACPDVVRATVVRDVNRAVSAILDEVTDASAERLVYANSIEVGARISRSRYWTGAYVDVRSHWVTSVVHGCHHSSLGHA